MAADQRTAREVLDAYLRELHSGYSERMVELFAAKVDWSIPGADDVPWLGERSTRDEIADYFTSHAGYVARDEFVVERVLADDRDGVALGYFKGRVKANNAPMESWFAIQVTVSDGLITRYRFYEDSLEVARAWRAPGRAESA
ncbi:nuclear transport factor 2 family protein [Streptomyces sp. NPDC059009]|uniref:nuclear transport factor 2 family protein n=1 Tax=Streptomyces sp. NPDC059009 TaxID=3346694 RepID=UPI0036A2A866